MSKNFFKVIFIFFSTFFVLENFYSFNKSLNAGNLSKNSSNNFSFKLNKNIFLRSLNINNTKLKLEENLNNLEENSFLNLLVSNKKEDLHKVQIESDTQYEVNNIAYAEGNVVIKISNAEIRAEKASYDREKKHFLVEGNVVFTKGNQFFEASNFFYDFSTESGFINNIYGVLDLITINEDSNIKPSKKNFNYSLIKEKNISDLRYINSATLGLENDFEEDKRFNVTDINLEIPQVTKWRFKSNKLIIKSNEIQSKNIYFTNDAFNAPQLMIQSKNFNTKFKDDKLKIVSRNSWIILENKLRFPIGRRTISDRDPITKWGIGSDYEEKDGFYISRGFGSIELSEDYFLKLRPYFLIQRALKGSTNSFTEKDSSILSEKVKNDIKFADIFAVDAEITKNFGSWDFLINSSFNSLNFDRFSELNRTKFTLTKSVDLNKSDDYFINQNNSLQNSDFNNTLDIQFYGGFREKVSKGFSNDQEIYLAKGFSIANRKTWNLGDKSSDLAFIYDLGIYKAEKKNVKEFGTLSRNVFAANYGYKFPLWKKNNPIKKITFKNKYSPELINQGIFWETSINSGIFLYGDGSTQEAIILNTGPELTLGALTKPFFDYTRFEANVVFPAKGNSSPFHFDDIDDNSRVQFNFEQQLFGPLIFGYDTQLNLEPNHNDYGKFKNHKFSLNVSRRAYSLSAYYEPSSEIAGIQFNIFNFDYEGISPKF